jgi:hypothetical protein
MEISRPICQYYIVGKKTNEGFENVTQVLQSGNVVKCSLTIMDSNITWLAKNTNYDLRG